MDIAASFPGERYLSRIAAHSWSGILHVHTSPWEGRSPGKMHENLGWGASPACRLSPRVVLLELSQNRQDRSDARCSSRRKRVQRELLALSVALPYLRNIAHRMVMSALPVGNQSGRHPAQDHQASTLWPGPLSCRGGRTTPPLRKRAPSRHPDPRDHKHRVTNRGNSDADQPSECGDQVEALPLPVRRPLHRGKQPGRPQRQAVSLGGWQPSTHRNEELEALVCSDSRACEQKRRHVASRSRSPFSACSLIQPRNAAQSDAMSPTVGRTPGACNNPT